MTTAEAGATALTAATLEVLRLPREADTLPALFRSRAARLGDRPFLVHGDRVHSWRQAADLAGRWAGHLAGMAAPGDRVAVVLPNCDSHVILFLACAQAGLVFVPVNPALTGGEMAAVLAVVTPALVIAAPAGAGKLAAAAVPRLLVLADEGLALPALPDLPPPAVEVGPDLPLAIVFTSGTTGVPKGAVHCHRTYVIAAEIAAFRMRLNGDDRLMVILPLFHLNALFYSIGGAIVCGGRLVVEERFQAGRFWQAVARHGVTQVNMIAAVGNILLKRDRSEFPGNATLRKVSAAPVTQEVATALREAFGITNVVESYGMTEAPGIAQVDFFDQGHRACLGRPIVHPLSGDAISEVRIVDEDRQPLPAGEVGRIMVRARTMMSGYFNRPDLSERLGPDGWFLTEDRGRADSDGYLYFCGRTADLIRTRGENVSAAEVEAALLTHLAVSEAGCIGIPSDLGEEDILAAIVPREGVDLDLGQVMRHCRERLSRHKLPRYLLVRAELPKTPTQKIAHHRLRGDPDLIADAIDVAGLAAR